MARTKVFNKDVSGDVEFNMTPMIDCTFLLIIFFILSATVLSDALAQLELCRPYESQATDQQDLNEMTNRIIINVVSEAESKEDVTSAKAATIKLYKVNLEKIPVTQRKKLIRLIKEGAILARERGFKDYYVEIRGDYRVKFGGVQDVLKAIAAVKVGKINLKMNITALTKTKG